MKRKKIVIVGGVAGGASAAARLRRLDEAAEIVMLERGPYISFANCGLPYHIGGEIVHRSALTLQTPESFRARFRVDARIHSEAVSVDRESRRVTVKDRATGEAYTEPYDKLILSTGAEPVRPPIPGVENERVFTLRSLPDAFRIKEYLEERGPKTAAVIGAGYVGVEMAENLTRAGLAVTLVEKQDQILAPLDYDMACDLHHHMEQKGVRLLLDCGVKSIAGDGEGLLAETEKGPVRADMVVMAVGVKPESGLAKEAGLALNERGGIRVDEHMRTSDPDIYAVGDAVEVTEPVTGEKAMIPLAGPANKQGRIAADNICGIESRYAGTQGSSILRVFGMTAATTGINEKAAKRLGVPYEKSFTYSGSHAGYFPGAENMSVKLLFDPESGRVLGAQVVGGRGADKRCDVIAAAMRFGATVKDLTELELCYAPPYSSAKDPVNMAGYAAENILKGLVEVFHWHDVKGLLEDGDAVFLDIRTLPEYERGHIAGSVHIPLDSLRDRLEELDRAKRYCVVCQVGLRGYIGCRILSQKGFRAGNLSGGYRLYRSVCGDHPPATGLG